ncbi:uncharacterized protein LOC128550376 [Mercenaria mercenaria]|uniref:uncharacterized protein LOC128550376 n=1 Tax=Mercenaria mercenaria TaxID=6596 RepID=UPI00234E65BD|nr:uncharacterized protein LOC128550376 [Mercenaria mercenaria]
MSTIQTPLENGKDISCTIPVQSSGLVDSDVLSLKSNVLFDNKVGAGDGYKLGLFAANTNKEAEEAAERYISVLDKRRIKRKLEEDGYEWKPSPKPDTENISNKIDSVLSKLKNRFGEEKQARADNIKPSYSQYIFSNSVDAFLRHHEKPQVEIQYSETEGSVQGEGLYTFAVKPSRIRKRRKDTPDTPRGNTNIYAVSPNEVTKRLSNPVSAVQNTGTSGDVLNHMNTVICSIPSAYEASDFTVSLLSKCTSPEKVNSYVIPPNDNILISGTIDSCIAPPTNTMMMTFEELLPIIDLIGTPSNPYFRATVPIYKVQTHTKAFDFAIPSWIEHHRSVKNNGFVIPPFERVTADYAIPEMLECDSSNRNDDYVKHAFLNVIISHDIPSRTEYHSLHQNDDYGLLPFQKVTIGHGFPSMRQSSHENGDHIISPFKRLKLKTKISSSSIYKTNMLANMMQTKRRIYDNSKHPFNKKPKAIEICGHILRLIHSVMADGALYGHSVTPIHNLTVSGGVCDNTIYLTGAFQYIEDSGTEQILELSIHKELSSTEIKEMYRNAPPPVRYMLTAKEHKSYATASVYRMTLAVEIYNQTVRQIYKVTGHTYKERCDKTVSAITRRTTLQTIPDKRLVLDKINDHVFHPAYKATSEKGHDYDKIPIDSISVLGNISDSTIKEDSKCHTAHEVHEAVYDTIIEESGDDSPFGILSIYCNSEIHSGITKC